MEQFNAAMDIEDALARVEFVRALTLEQISLGPAYFLECLNDWIEFHRTARAIEIAALCCEATRRDTRVLRDHFEIIRKIEWALETYRARIEHRWEVEVGVRP